MLKYFILIMGFVFFMLGCKSSDNNDVEKLAITAKMQEKVRKVSIELKAYCDSETYRKARNKADSILRKQQIKKMR